MKRVGLSLLLALTAAAPAMADAMTDGEAPAILAPAPGATVASPVTVTIKPGGMAAMPGMAQGAHLHLIVDAPLPAAGTTIPMDAHHIHLMHGETGTTLTLAPGPHTIQLIEGGMSHGVAADAPHSDPVTFAVK